MISHGHDAQRKRKSRAAKAVSSVVWRRSPGNVLTERVTVYVGIWSDVALSIPHVYLSRFGMLTIMPGFEWDGPSGPTLATDSTMVASAVHDALYSLISAGQLSREWRGAADEMLHKLMIANGASPLRAWYYWAAVRLFGWLHV